jgi:hypothetical protein
VGRGTCPRKELHAIWLRFDAFTSTKPSLCFKTFARATNLHGQFGALPVSGFPLHQPQLPAPVFPFLFQPTSALWCHFVPSLSLGCIQDPLATLSHAGCQFLLGVCDKPKQILSKTTTHNLFWFHAAQETPEAEHGASALKRLPLATV